MGSFDQLKPIKYLRDRDSKRESLRGSKDGDPFEHVRKYSTRLGASRASRHKPSIDAARFEDIPETEFDGEDDE